MNDNDIQQTLGEIKDMITKSAEVATTYTWSPATRSIFSPQNLDEKIKYLVPIDTPLRNRFPRGKGLGEAAVWKVMTSAVHSGMHPSANALTGTGTSIAFADAAAPGESTQTYSTATAVYKLLGRKLEVGGLALASSKGREGEPDMQAARERIKMYEVMLGEEELIIAGDATARTSEFSGLNKQITTNSGSCTFITASGVGAWCQSLYKYGANPTLLISSAKQLQALADDLEKSGSIQRVVIAQGQQGSVVGGLSLSKIVNPVTGTLIEVTPSRFVGYGGLLLTEKSPAGENWIEMEDLIPMSRVDVPSSTFSYVSFLLEAVACKVIGEPFQLKFNTGA
jgi:hypothetical protein